VDESPETPYRTLKPAALGFRALHLKPIAMAEGSSRGSDRKAVRLPVQSQCVDSGIFSPVPKRSVWKASKLIETELFVFFFIRNFHKI